MENKSTSEVAGIKKAKYFCITQMLPDLPIKKINPDGTETEIGNDGGLHYYCGLSKIDNGNGEVLVGHEWSKKEDHAELYLTEDVARQSLEPLLEDNPFAVVGIVWKEK